MIFSQLHVVNFSSKTLSGKTRNLKGNFTEKHRVYLPKPFSYMQDDVPYQEIFLISFQNFQWIKQNEKLESFDTFDIS